MPLHIDNGCLVVLVQVDDIVAVLALGLISAVRPIDKELICNAPSYWLLFEHLRRLVNQVAMTVPNLDMELLFFSQVHVL